MAVRPLIARTEPFAGRERTRGASGPSGLWIFLFCTLAACQSDAGTRLRTGEVLHPTPPNEPPGNAAVIRSGDLRTGEVGDHAEWASKIKRLLDARPVLSIGDDSEGPSNFGRILDAAVSSSGHLFLLDGPSQEVRIFDSAGRFVQALGGVGDGPGEFRYANRIDLTSDGRLVVASRGLPELDVFSQTDSGWIPGTALRLPTAPDDLCVGAGGELVIAGYRREENTVVHVIDKAPHDSVRSFAPGYQADHWLLQDQLGKGMVACLADPARIVFAYELLPVVRSFDLGSGDLGWTSRIENHHQPVVIHRVRPDGRIGIRRGHSGTEDLVAELHAVTRGYLLLQVARADRGRNRNMQVLSYLVDADTGSGIYMGNEALPPVLSVFESGYVAMFEDPYPRVEVRVY